MTDENTVDPQELGTRLVEQLWAHHLERSGKTAEDPDVPPMGILTTAVIDEDSGRIFRLSVYETTPEEEAELGLDAEAQLNLLLLRTQRIMVALDEVTSRPSGPQVGVMKLSGPELMRILADSPGVLSGLLGGLGGEPDDIVVGPTVPLDDLVINDPEFDLDTDLHSSSSLSRIHTSYGHLVEKLGMPRELPTDTSRIDAQWTLEWDDGDKLTICNLDDGPVTLGADGPTVEELSSWFVFGNRDDVMVRLADLIGLTRGPRL